MNFKSLLRKLKIFIKDIQDGPGAVNPIHANKVLVVNSDGTQVIYEDDLNISTIQIFPCIR